MGFQSGFEEGKRVEVPDVRGKGVPQLGSRATESSTPHGAEAGRGNSEKGRGGGSEGTGGSGDVEEIRQVGRSKVVDRLEGEKEYLEVNSKFNREPVKLLQYWGNVMK